MRIVILLVAATVIPACTDDERPTDHVFSQTTSLRQYATCGALEADLKDLLIREIWADIDRADRDWGFGGGIDDSATPESGDSGGGRQEGVDFSGTNNQEAGVDEADLVKTDGFHIYNLNGNRLHIFAVPQFGELVPVSVTQLEGHPRQMLIHKEANKAVVFSFIDVTTLPKEHPLRPVVGVSETETNYWWRSRMISKITVLDITDRAAPRLVREVYYEGYYQTARRVDSSVRVAAYAQIERRELWDWYQILNDTGSRSKTKKIVAQRINALVLADLIPQMYTRTPDGKFTTDSLSTNSCQQFFRPTDSHARGISSIISFDLFGPTLAWDADHVVSNQSTFYSSTDTIILAEPAHNWWWYWWFPEDPDQLNVHAFDISRAGKTSYVGSGRVTGRLVDQFAIDEEAGAIRLATTTDAAWRWWDDAEARPEPENHVWVLERQPKRLVRAGHIGGIAPGERIMSARFLEDKAFLVTFRQVDPLFTIDLSDRTQPKVAGELKVPGFSTYLHPVGDSTLLSIGVGGTETGANWRTTISLFDVSDFANPRQTATLPIEAAQGWGWSEAQWEHKAFQYWAPKKLLAVPQATYAYTTNGYRYISRLELITVEPGVGLTHHGAIDHTPYYEADADQYWYYTDIRRSIFMGDFVYAISDKAITAHRTSDLVRVAEATLPGYVGGDWWWWW